MIELLKAGPLTTVQDLGRMAWRDRGISRCGALDDLALCQANLLVGNDVGAAGLEFTLGPALLRLQADGWLALTAPIARQRSMASRCAPAGAPACKPARS